MGTSTMGSDLHSDKQDKVLKLQARKKELELLLSAKNEELYKLCVQEVHLTGIMPPEAPLSPEVPQRERLGSVRSSGRGEGDDVRDGSDTTSRRVRHGAGDRLHDSDQNLRKNLSHRLSTPSISGLSTKSLHSRHMRRPETSCSNFFPSPPQERSDTFSMHTSHTYPALSGRHEPLPENMHCDTQSNVYYRHQTTNAEYMNKIYHGNVPEAHSISRLRETHFSSSHPDITTSYGQCNVAPQPVPQQNNARTTPLLYQYASQLKAQSQHLGALAHHHQMPVQTKRRPEGSRRSTLQRTQTYHLTSNSDYNQHLENITDSFRQPPAMYQHRSQPDIQEQPDRVNMPTERTVTVPNTLPLRERNTRNPLHMQLQVSTDDYTRDDRRHYPDALSPISQMSGYSQGNFDSVSMNSKFSPISQSDLKMKEKQWYETSLDSPTKSEAQLLKKSSNLKRTSSVGNSQAYEIMMSTGRNSALQSPNQAPHSPVVSPTAVSLEMPNNLTVIEQGKCIPYREETKPFEMSDFYKYSTKFRQAQKAATNPVPNVSTGYHKLPMELPQYAQEHWHGQSH